MSTDSGRAIVEDVSRLPQVDLTQLADADELLVETRRERYTLFLAALDVNTHPPMWIAQTRGADWLRSRMYALIGADTNYHQVQLGTKIEVAALELNRLIRGFPMVLGDMHDGCAVMGPIEHVWLNSTPIF